MRFNQRYWRTLCCALVCGVLLGLHVLSGCDANIPSQDEVFGDAAQRVEANLLPPFLNESETVLRNVLNLLAALPEICSTPLATLGSFVSSMPALGVPVRSTFDDEEGSWEIVWQNVVLGDTDGQLTSATNALRVNLTLTIRYLSPILQTLRALPFSLVPQTTLQTGGEPPSVATGTVEGFFVFQNVATGEWTVRWNALDTKVFEGRINAPVSRVIQRVAAGDTNVVTSLEVNDNQTEIRFEDTTAPTDTKGFTFFVKPGESIRFRLRIGPVDDSLQQITQAQLRVGGNDQLLPASEDPGDFRLASSLPIDPTGEPAFGNEVGTFIWQDVTTNACDVLTEDQWRVRFSIAGTATTFTGTVVAVEDGAQARLRSTAVGSCPAGSLSNGDKQLTYDCVVQDNTPSGYDVCVSRGRRVTFAPRVNDVRDPGKVFVGAARVPPPSPYPFAIRFEPELTESVPSIGLVFPEDGGIIVLRGNNEEEGALLLNPDQVSFDPLCSIPGEVKQRLPRVRLTGAGDYSTDSFEGSRYILGEDEDEVGEDVEFTMDIDPTDNPLADARRFPDRGQVRLETRLEGELENSIARTFMEDIQDLNGRVVLPADAELNVNGVIFRFPNANFPNQVGLTVE